MIFNIEPFETETKVRMRIDGVIMEYVTIQRNIHAPLIARIKILSNLDIAEKRIPQDGHFRVTLEGGSVNIRVSILPTVFGEKAVLRIMAATTHMDHADHFGMDDYSYNQFAPMLNIRMELFILPDRPEVENRPRCIWCWIISPAEMSIFLPLKIRWRRIFRESIRRR